MAIAVSATRAGGCSPSHGRKSLRAIIPAGSIHTDLSTAADGRGILSGPPRRAIVWPEVGIQVRRRERPAPADEIEQSQTDQDASQEKAHHGAALPIARV